MSWNASVGIPLAIFGAIVFASIYWFGRPKKPRQGRRMIASRESGERIEPTFGADDVADGSGQVELDMGMREELQRLGSEIAAKRSDGEAATSNKPVAGVRPDMPIERIVTLFVAAPAEADFHGPDLVVAAEKAGLDFGDLGIFHRLISGKPEAGPVFSMSNMVKPGSFDMTQIESLRTPGVSFFMTLPGPMPALDAWEAMLPTAQRLAELLDGRVLDEGRNALGRQRIAHLRDELRAWDRKQERNQIRPR
ncbi:MAG: cell division protein ZipA [Proteobacteria bacterium]|nr:cell division protein ZipA [Pseudomonadota bacterium]